MVGLLLAGFAGAQVSDVRLNAPEPLRRLIQAHIADFTPGAASPGEHDVQALARRLRREIEEMVATEGYFAPQIDVRALTGESGEQVVVTVDGGPRTVVSRVGIDFSGDIAGDSARIATLRAAWSLAVGRAFRQDDWDAAKRALLSAVVAEDYAAGRIADSRAEIDPQAATAELTVVVASGPRFRIGEVQVEGLERYSRDLVERYGSIAPGAAYRREALLDLQTALQNSPYFSSVLVAVDPDPAKADAAPLRILVRERKSRRLGLSGGYSTNTGYRGEISYRDHNLLSRAWDLSAGLRVEQRRRFAYADVVLPPGGKNYRDSFGVLAERDQAQGLKTTRYAAGAVRTRLRDNIETRLALNLQHEKRSVAGVDEGYAKALALDWGWTYRDVDDVLDPRRGYVWEVNLGGATKILLSDQNFARVYTRMQRYVPVGRRDVLIWRAELGLVAARSRSGIPESFLFRAGGAQSLRGYAYRSIGEQESGAVVGARALAVGSVEFLHWLDANWGVAAFVDAGDASDRRRSFQLHSGYGLGVRWRSPVGPLAVDLAYGHQLRKLRLHFSVAIPF